jgi:superfamily II DNA/RNA helicase
VSRPRAKCDDVTLKATILDVHMSVIATPHVQYGILFGSKKERVQKTGVLFRDAFEHRESTVHTRMVGFVDVWAKVIDGQLCEVYGKCGNDRIEEHVLRAKYAIKALADQPRAPAVDAVSDDAVVDPGVAVHRAYTVDAVGTRFADDAISLAVVDGETVRLGIHVVDLTRIWSDALTEDAHRRCMSIYWKSIADTPAESCFHMLHPSLLERHSLSAHQTRACVTLWCTIRDGQVLDEWHERTTVCVARAFDYPTFDAYLAASDGDAHGGAHDVESDRVAYGRAFGDRCARDAVQWCMVRYNQYMKQRLESALTPAIFYSVSDRIYAPTTDDHGTCIVQATSPLRRFVDAYNQCALLRVPMHSNAAWTPDIGALSARMAGIKAFQVMHRTLRLASACRSAPMMLHMAKHPVNPRLVHVSDDRGARHTVSKFDSFVSTEMIVDGARALVWGVLHRGRSVLKAQELTDDAPVVAPPAFAHASTPTTDEDATTTASTTTTTTLADLMSVDEYIQRIEEMYGYPLDDFQAQCARVIHRGDDLLGMAPTGSGKTTVAMMGIVAAFLMGKKVVYTSPIKALSNEKYMEMRRLCEGGRVSIVTGDIKHRCMPCGTDDSELLIMTAEIFRNKLSTHTEIEHIGVVIQDEVHYISDAERGCVWEESIMLTPKRIQIISLSATIDEPDGFCRWLSTRRPTTLVQNKHRHVPLHVGAWDGREFRRLYTTNQVGGVGGMTNLKAHTTPAVMVEYLKRSDLLPAIFFCMSKARCMSYAHSIQNSVCIDPKPVKQKDQHDDEFADLLKVHSHDVRAWRNEFDATYRMYILPYHATLVQLDGFHEFVRMLELGVAYHHSGMIPILREWVEILFRKKIVRVVFATETLGVGINMPSRTVVFTQLEKPCGRGSSDHVEYRPFTNDEFWQMAGRAGRRGMDTQGFVMYAPTTAHISSMCTLSGMIRGKHQRASSQLTVSTMFVLRNIPNGADVLRGSLLQYELQQQQRALERESEQATLPTWTDAQLALVADSECIHRALSDLIKPPLKKQRQMEQTLRSNIAALGGESVWKAHLDRQRQRQSVDDHASYLSNQWERAVQLLVRHEFVHVDRTYTKKGLACVCMSDDTAIVRACVLFDGGLSALSFAELVAWMSGFVEIDSGVDVSDDDRVALPDALTKVFETTNAMCEYFELPPCNWSTVAVMFDWCTTKSIHRVVQSVGFSRFGAFVKMVLRVSSLLDEWCGMLLGIEDFAMYNRLDGYNERLFDSIVSPKSLYVDVS